MPLHNVTITSMTHGGEGVGRLPNGKAVFVPYTLPDEVIAIEVTQERKTFARARLLEVETPSPARIAARCAHFGICGGCHWQHIAYDTQLTLKRQIVQDQLTRIGKLTDPLVHPTIPSPQQWNYRAHVTFHGIADGVAFVGADKSSKVELHECHIIAPELWDVRYVSNGKRVRLLLGDGGAILGSEGQREGDTELDSVGVGDSFVTLTVLGKPFKVSAGSFFQVNLPQAAKLVELILSALALNGTERVLDLYSGVGLFSAFLAERAAHVTAIESAPSSVADARVNVPTVEMIEAPVEDALQRIRGTVDAVVTDPPRAGMQPQAIAELLRIRPRTIAYVSCDPATLARDLRLLTEGGYTLQWAQPVDMFPQTYHIETLALLTVR